MDLRMKLLYNSILIWTLFDAAQARPSGRKATQDPKIAILGAGMAGVTVAERLQELGYNNLLIIEGSDRIGGRMKNIQFCNYTLNQGANWIQSLGSNPIFKLARKYGLEYKLTDYEDFKTYDKNGNDVTTESNLIDEKFYESYKKVGKYAQKMVDNNEVDSTYRAGLIRKYWNPKSRLDDLMEYYYHDFEFAAPPEASSLKESLLNTYDIHGNDDNANVIDQRGYAHIPESMIRQVMQNGGVKLHMDTYVTEIKQTGEGVKIKTKDGRKFHADFVIVTFSIGVLQNRLVNFRPKLPEWKLDAIDQIQQALYYNIFFKFPYKFWDDNQFFLYASERRGYYPIFQNFNKLIPNSNILHVTVTGEEARRVHRIPRKQVKREVMAILNEIYSKPDGTEIPQPIDYVLPELFTDPLFMGSYSNIPPGYTPERQRNLSVPIDRVYFAGEANNPDHSGYVHGAWYSGRETAQNLHDFISGN